MKYFATYFLLSYMVIESTASSIVHDVTFIPPTFAARKSILRSQKKEAENLASFIPEDDLKRAVECADNFGKCTPKEIEHLRNELHTDRAKLFADETSGLASPLKYNDELGRRLLEEDLTLQLALLNDEIGLPMDETIAVDEKKWNEGNNAQVRALIDEGILSFTFESMMVCVAIVLVMLAPHLIHT